MASSIAEELARAKAEIETVSFEKRERLKNIEFFLLDNSIRESTVGQLRSHTLETKLEIYKHVLKAGAKHIIVATFAHMTRVDDDFCQWIVDNNVDRSGFFSFTEVFDRIVDGAYDTETVPISMLKNQQYGVYNTIFEVNLANNEVEWDVKFTIKDLCQLVSKWIHWVHDNIERAKGADKPKNFLNFRDLPQAMMEHPERVLELLIFLTRMPEKYHLFGIMYEDTFGEYLPEEMAACTTVIRRIMNANDWSSGKLLIHIHQKWDLQTASQLACLSAGADGVWASMCEEGGAMGHASSCVTMMNLVRMGNEKVVKDYNCKYLRTAATEITRLTTGKDPHPKQPIYGSRAADLVFGFLGLGVFDVANYFGEEAPNRITTFATVEMLKDRLETLFGENKDFNEKICARMKELMLEDLRSGRKEEYMSEAGIALLFNRSGGKRTERMNKVIVSAENAAPHHEAIITDIRKLWDEYDYHEKSLKKGDDCLQFDSFYHGFMAPYVGCYQCGDTKAFQAIDMDSDNKVHWQEFMVYIKWALRQYPDLTTADQALEIVFEKGLIPAMRDEYSRSEIED
uniref:Ilborin D n=1 Tax=Halisarca dujardinii TaxID=2583056 RepID=A0A7T0LY87_HALDU|nr:ilborin D [Halisarca dujardinii]